MKSYSFREPDPNGLIYANSSLYIGELDRAIIINWISSSPYIEWAEGYDFNISALSDPYGEQFGVYIES